MKKIYLNPTMRVVPICVNPILADSKKVPVGGDGNANEAEAREDFFSDDDFFDEDDY